MSRCIGKEMNLEKPKCLIIWNGGSTIDQEGHIFNEVKANLMEKRKNLSMDAVLYQPYFPFICFLVRKIPIVIIPSLF